MELRANTFYSRQSPPGFRRQLSGWQSSRWARVAIDSAVLGGLVGCVLVGCGLLACVLVGCDPGGQLRGAGSCPMLSCESGVQLVAALSPKPSDLAALLGSPDVVFCRNGVCVHSPLSPAEGGSSYSCSAVGPLTKLFSCKSGFPYIIREK